MSRPPLTAAELETLLTDHDRVVVVRSRPHNDTTLLRYETRSVDELLPELREAVYQGHLPGGDIEIRLSGGRRILGNHDGVFRLAD